MRPPAASDVEIMDEPHKTAQDWAIAEPNWLELTSSKAASDLQWEILIGIPWHTSLSCQSLAPKGTPIFATPLRSAIVPSPLRTLQFGAWKKDVNGYPGSCLPEALDGHLL